MAPSGSDSTFDERLLLPDRYGDRAAAGIRWYAGRLLRKRFFAVRAAPGTTELLSSLDGSDRPAIVCMSHSSWWDPLVGIHLWDRCFPSRRILGPMRRRELEQFAFFRRVGVFGIDPDLPASLEAMRRFVLPRLVSATRDVLMLTPQGALSDPRAEIVVRPGAAAIAAGLGADRPAVIAVAFEYAFWNDQRPEVFVEAAEATPREDGAPPSTASWHRAIRDALRQAASSLARRVIARDPAGFDRWSGGRTAVHPVFDLWLRATGRGGEIDDDGRSREVSPAKDRSA